MKEHAKKALKHDFEVAGKTIPTLAIAALFLVGTGSAALLSSFGTVSGTADVSQAVTLDADSGQNTVNYAFDGTQTAGETVVETHTLHNNANVSAQADFASYCEKGSDTVETSGGADTTSEDINWGESDNTNCKGIDTHYVEYFDEAGHDFSNYNPGYSSNDNNVVYVSGSGSAIQDAIDNDVTDSTEAVLVGNGDYNSFTVDKDLKVVAENQGEATVSGGSPGITVTANGATVKGFDVQATGSPDARGISIEAKNVVVSSNTVHNVKAERNARGIYLAGKDAPVDSSEVVNNKISDVVADDPSQDSRSVGVGLSDDNSESADNVRISGNTIEQIGTDTDSKISLGVDVLGGYAQNFEITYNEFREIDEISGDSYTYTAGGVYFSGYGDDGADHPSETVGYGADHMVSYNNFLLSSVDDAADVKLWDAPHDGHLNASNNYWGENGLDYEVHDVVYEGDETGAYSDGVDASWADVGTTVEAGVSDKFAVVTDFAINLKPDTYSLTTNIVPANGESTS